MATKLSEVMEERGVSAYDLAVGTGMQYSIVYDLARGASSIGNMKYKAVRRMADYLGVETWEIAPPEEFIRRDYSARGKGDGE